MAWFPARPATETQSDPGYEVTNWFGILSSRGTPPVIVTMLNGTLKKITQDAEFQSRMAAQGTEPFILSSEQFKKFIASEVSKWAKLGSDYNLRVE